MNNRNQAGFTRSCNNFELPGIPGLGAPCRAHGLPPPPRGDLERGHPLVPGGESKLWTISRQSLPGASPRPELSEVQVNVLVHVLGVVLLHLTYPEQFMLKIWPGDPFYLWLASFLSQAPLPDRNLVELHTVIGEPVNSPPSEESLERFTI